jgi:hypothetical protein
VVPKDCASLVSHAMIGISKDERRLLVVDEQAALARAMEIGVADAICLFEPDRQAAGVACKLADQLQHPGATE